MVRLLGEAPPGPSELLQPELAGRWLPWLPLVVWGDEVGWVGYSRRW